jgi:unsaturated chondroitin disaccharide hydrolase
MLEGYDGITPEETGQAMKFASDQVIRNLRDFTYQFPNTYSEDNFYRPVDNTQWTNGFWTGELWLAYEYCGDERLKAAAEIQIDSFYHRMETKIAVDHHDMGFLYSLSCVAGYKLTGNKKAREAAIKAADQLSSRYRPAGEFIQAWGAMKDTSNYRLIVDCLMNVPLLYWAYRETGEEAYRETADRHIHTTMKNIVRPDNSTWHTFFFNPQTGEPDHGATCQGYRDASAWARGQAWGVYGSALAYRYTRREEFIDIFDRVTGYFLEHLPKDLVPFWDLEFTDGSGQPRDSSSAVIAACGMLEMAGHTDTARSSFYKSAAAKLMKSVYDRYAVKDPRLSNGLILHGTYSNHSPYNTCLHQGVDECNIWGDYFYFEALTRISKEWEPYW